MNKVITNKAIATILSMFLLAGVVGAYANSAAADSPRQCVWHTTADGINAYTDPLQASSVVDPAERPHGSWVRTRA